MKNGKVADYFNPVSGSWGWQAGLKSYACVVILMSDCAIKYLEKSKSWNFATEPNITVVNETIAKNLTTSTLKDDAYIFIFDQQGLIASLGIKGIKINRIKR